MTTRGFGVLALAVIGVLGSILFSSQFLLTMAAFFFLLLLVCGVWSYTHKKKISVNRSTAPEYVYEDSDVVVTLDIANLDTDASIQDFFDNGTKTTRFFVPRTRDRSLNAQYKLKTEKRGVYTVGPIVVTSSDFLGLFNRKYDVKSEAQMRVYPKISDVVLPRIPLRSSEQSRHMDRNASTLSDDLMGLKEYVMGDDVRLIHWKTSSRTQDLFVRHRERQATLPLVIILDCESAAYANEDEFDAAARVIASISYAAQLSDIPCRMFCNDNGEFIATHPAIMDRLAVSEPTPYVQSKADSSRLLSDFEHNYIFVTGSHGEVFSSAVLTLRIVPQGPLQPDTFNMIPLRVGNECEDFTTRIKQWNVHASLQSL